jgi:hypothetical protein
MIHRTGYCRKSLESKMIESGFVNVEVKSVIGYRPTPSLLGIGQKQEA